MDATTSWMFRHALVAHTSDSSLYKAKKMLVGGKGTPPPGYGAVPGSRAGGYRKRVGGKWQYWYPELKHTPKEIAAVFGDDTPDAKIAALITDAIRVLSRPEEVAKRLWRGAKDTIAEFPTALHAIAKLSRQERLSRNEAVALLSVVAMIGTGAVLGVTLGAAVGAKGVAAKFATHTAMLAIHERANEAYTGVATASFSENVFTYGADILHIIKAGTPASVEPVDDEEAIDFITTVLTSMKKVLSTATPKTYKSFSPTEKSMRNGRYADLLSKAKGDQKAGHKYKSRRPKSGGGYDYDYGDGKGYGKKKAPSKLPGAYSELHPEAVSLVEMKRDSKSGYKYNEWQRVGGVWAPKTIPHGVSRFYNDEYRAKVVAALATDSPYAVFRTGVDPNAPKEQTPFSKAKGDQRAGHKYRSRKPDGKGGWLYDYGDGHEKPKGKDKAPEQTSWQKKTIETARGNVASMFSIDAKDLSVVLDLGHDAYLLQDSGGYYFVGDSDSANSAEVEEDKSSDTRRIRWTGKKFVRFEKSMRNGRYADLLSKAKGDQRAGHKYRSRKPDGKGGWAYDYADSPKGPKGPKGGGTTPVDIERAKAALNELANGVDIESDAHSYITDAFQNLHQAINSMPYREDQLAAAALEANKTRKTADERKEPTGRGTTPADIERAKAALTKLANGLDTENAEHADSDSYITDAVRDLHQAMEDIMYREATKGTSSHPAYRRDTQKSMRNGRYTDLLSKAKGDQRASHKYRSRKPDGKGGWTYDYDDTYFQADRTGKSDAETQTTRVSEDTQAIRDEYAETANKIERGIKRGEGSPVPMSERLYEAAEYRAASEVVEASASLEDNHKLIDAALRLAGHTPKRDIARDSAAREQVAAESKIEIDDTYFQADKPRERRSRISMDRVDRHPLMVRSRERREPASKFRSDGSKARETVWGKSLLYADLLSTSKDGEKL